MIKRIEFDLNPKEHQIELIDFKSPLIKTAEISNEMQEAISNIKPDNSKSYILVNALGAGEYWGSNKNADYFPEVALKEYHKTFELAGIYKHHANKDPSKSLGKVAFSHYNNDMHRVELLLEVDAKKAPDIVQKIAKNESVPVSMGTKVPYDTCTRCYKKASKPDEYCDHIKREKNKIYPDGVKVAMVNRYPRFFDISFVTVPADRTAYMLKKVAEVEEPELSAKLGEDWLREAQLKESDIDKRLNIEIPEEDITVLERTKKKLKLPENLPGDLPESWLKEAAQKFSSVELLSAMAYTQIMPTPRDFQFIVLNSINKEAAYNYYKDNINFIPQEKAEEYKSIIWESSESAIQECSKIAQDYSLTIPNIFSREFKKISELITHQPQTQELPLQRTQTPLLEDPQNPKPLLKNPFIPLTILAGLYYSFNKFFKSVGLGTPSPLETEIYKNPILLPILIGGASWGAVKLQDMKNKQYQFNKTAGTPNYWLERALVAFPGTYIYAGYQETKRQRGEQLNTAQDFVRKHPLLSSLGVFWGSKKLIQAGKSLKDKYAELFIELNQEDFEEIYEKIIN